MVAVRGKNFRSGDLAEELGLLLMQNLALVAPIPRTEDVGVDAVVTLLSEFQNGCLLAEDNFFVQIKSSSVEVVEYEGHQVEWLYKLELPFFVATVDREKGLISLYCCHRLSNAFITNHQREKIKIHLNDKNTYDEFVYKDDENVHVGPPVLEWSLTKLAEEKEFPMIFYNIMKEHISYYNANLRYRDVGWIDICTWKTNEVPEFYASAGAQSRTFDESQQILESSLNPYIFRWLNGMMIHQKWTDTAEAIYKLMGDTKDTINTIGGHFKK
ncbi:hypothetical protein OM409_14685 [Serratia bockelmannii]|nr:MULTISPECIES: hypothetical protein [Serratia]MCW7648765.1 hypothetical protein [Serratia bockelmannii]MCW7658760.1 hypothetical protein [Serratia bockelmannii]MCW7678334.1 hypothetical protein [Serratia bockelmannii]MCW7683111.1 hypothetical protein [Serratia bockelmannii]MCW7688098.1 hypothetical protein [Serratia bockelmannii]